MLDAAEATRPWIYEVTLLAQLEHREVTVMIGIRYGPRGREPPLCEHGNFIVTKAVTMSRHAAKEWLQGRADKRNLAIAGVEKQRLRKRLNATGGDDYTMACSQVSFQLGQAGLEEDRLRTRTKFCDMLPDETGEVFL